MRVIAVVAALLLLLAGLPPGTAAAGDKTTVTVKTDPATAGTKVEILDPQGNRLAGGTTDANGEFKAEVELPKGVHRVVIATDNPATGERHAHTSSTIGPATSYSHTVRASDQSDAPAILARIRQAVANCDKAEYDRGVAELDKRIADLEQQLDREQAEADDYARENGLRITNLGEAIKDLDRTAKAQAKMDASLRNPEILEKLRTYIEKLAKVERTKRALDDVRQARQAVPPFRTECKEKDKHSMAPPPGKCPDGSGGLLAGSINDIFGTDLDPACADRSQRRDTEREKKDEHGHKD